VRERLKAGDSDGQVIDYLVSRYGEFVLLNPRFNWHTALLWFAPFTVLLAGAIGLLLLIRRRRTDTAALAAARTLTPEEEARLARLLDEPTQEHSRS
jgi:cytochrome c-type biogenesis protein CcmH